MDTFDAQGGIRCHLAALNSLFEHRRKGSHHLVSEARPFVGSALVADIVQIGLRDYVERSVKFPLKVVISILVLLLCRVREFRESWVIGSEPIDQPAKGLFGV